MLTKSASPVLRTAKLAKLTLDLRWQEVFRRYDANDPHTRGELYILSDSQAILHSLYGLSDPSVVQTEGIENNDQYYNHAAKCLVDGARKELDAYKKGLYFECTHRHTAREQIRGGGRSAVAAALRPMLRQPQTVDLAAQDVEDVSTMCWSSVPLHDVLMAKTPADAVAENEYVDGLLPISTTHREKNPSVSRVIAPSLVARKVPAKEMKTNQAVIDALKVEVRKHLDAPWPKCPVRNPKGNKKGTWDVSTVIEKTK